MGFNKGVTPLPLMKQNLKRRLSDFPLDKQIRFLLGSVLLRMRPEEAATVDAAPYSSELNAMERLLRNGLYYQALRKRDFATLGRYLKDYWSVDAGVDFHERFSERFDDQFLLRDVRLMPEVERLLTDSPQYTTLCELGCGNGMVLDYYREHLPAFERYLGLDLSTVEIEKNRARYDAALEFEVADITEWSTSHPTQGIVFLTNGGVLECIAPDELNKLIRMARKDGGPVAFAITENIAIDHQDEIDRQSHVYAWEFAFSHNYHYLFRAAGYRIRYSHERIINKKRWLNIIAEYPGNSSPTAGITSDAEPRPRSSGQAKEKE